MRAVLLDTGALVGLLHDGDVHHASAVASLKRSADEGRALVSAWEVVGEAFTLIRTRISPRRQPLAAMTVLRWAEDSGVLLEQSIEADQRRAMQLLRLHADVPLSYVDALVLAISERLGVDELQTVDRHLGAVRLSRPLLVTVV